MSIELWMIRHGQTEWNIEGRFQGWQDSPLTEAGVEMAEEMRGTVLAFAPDAIYTSPAGRAARTAEILFAPREIQRDDLLREIGLGEMEGLTQEEAKARFPQLVLDFWGRPDAFVPPGEGETFWQVMDRAEAFLKKIEERHERQRVCVVSHGATILAMLCVAEGRNPGTIWQQGLLENGKATPLIFDAGKWSRKE